MIESEVIDDLEVIGRIRLGDRNAFARLVIKYEVKVRGYCFNVLSNTQDAEDAAQEIFIKSFNSLDSFRGDSSFGTWVYRIALNHCRDLLRKRKRKPTQSLDQLIENEGDRFQMLLTSQPSAADSVENRQLLSKLFAALPEQYREVLVLREVQGCSYQEISEVLECSLDAVKARIRRARAEILVHSRHLFANGDVKDTKEVV